MVEKEIEELKVISATKTMIINFVVIEHGVLSLAL